jgi:hypothetical protein
MRLDDETRTRLFADMTLDVDPTGSTVEVSIDGVWHVCDWQGSPVQSAGKWTQTARTTGYFAGPAATADGATVLAAGRHLTQTRVSWPGGDSLVEPSTPIDVKTNY